MGVLDNERGLIVTPDGQAAEIKTVLFSPQDAETFRAYKKLLQAHGLREALYCNDCWEGQLSDGCEAHVTPSNILVRCRCKMRYFQGTTY